MSDVTVTFAIVIAIVVLFIWDRFPVVRDCSPGLAACLPGCR
jgi:hypothetical protein